VDGLNYRVCGSGGWFAVLVPIAKLLPPEFPWKDLFSALETFRNFGLWGRHYLVVGEAIDVADLDTFNEQAVKAGEIVSSPLVGRGMRLLPIARHWSREMRRVLLPRSWPWRLKMKFGCRACESHKGLFTCCGLVITPNRILK